MFLIEIKPLLFASISMSNYDLSGLVIGIERHILLLKPDTICGQCLNIYRPIHKNNTGPRNNRELCDKPTPCKIVCNIT